MTAANILLWECPWEFALGPGKQSGRRAKHEHIFPAQILKRLVPDIPNPQAQFYLNDFRKVCARGRTYLLYVSVPGDSGFRENGCHARKTWKLIEERHRWKSFADRRSRQSNWIVIGAALFPCLPRVGLVSHSRVTTIPHNGSP